MQKWSKPEILNLNFRQTKGNPGASGNDQMIDDCVEDLFSFMNGPTGAYPFTPSGLCNVGRDYKK